MAKGKNNRECNRDDSGDGEQYVVFLRGLLEPQKNAHKFLGETFVDAFAKALASDTTETDEPTMIWRDKTGAIALDLDRPGDGARIEPHEVDGMFPESLPRPLAVWITHGGGLRAIFVEDSELGYSAESLAGVWHLLAPLGCIAGWRCEVKTESRHPSGLRGNESCGEVRWFTPSGQFRVPGNASSVVTSGSDIANWLDDHSLDIGRRYPHSLCPFLPSQSSGSDPVVVSDSGVRCFHCEGLGLRSWATFDVLVGGSVESDRPSLWESARAFVHFPHQHYVLQDLRPTTPDNLLKPAWAAILKTVNADRRNDKEAWERVIQAGRDTNLSIVRSASGVWLDARTLRPRRKITERSVCSLPSTWGGLSIDAALDTLPLPGYVNLQPVDAGEVRNPFAKPLAGAIFVPRPCREGDPPLFEIGAGPPAMEEVEDAGRQLRELFQHLDLGLLMALILAGIEAQHAGSTPPLIVVGGLPGTGKTATALLAGAAIGRPAKAIPVGGDAKAVNRAAGLAIEEGAGILYTDEFGRRGVTFDALAPALAFNTRLRFEAKYANEREVPFTAAVAMFGSNLPHAIFGGEANRRGVGYQLLDRVTAPWELSCDPIEDARKFEHIRIPLDVLTRYAYWQIVQAGGKFNWRQACLDHLGATEIINLNTDEADVEAQYEAIAKIYEYWRKAPLDDLYSGAGWGPDWLEASPGTPVWDALSGLVDFDADKNVRFGQIAELGRANLAEILGFDQPKLQLKMHERSARKVIKFVQLKVRRGEETPRTSMPPATPPATWKKSNVV